MGHEALAAILVFLNLTTGGISTQWKDAKTLDSPVTVNSGLLEEEPQFEANNHVQAMGQKPGGDNAAKAQETNLFLDQEIKYRIEKTLTALGYDCGKIDGFFDAETRSAIRDFQRQWSFRETGYIDDVTFVRLLAIGIF